MKVGRMQIGFGIVAMLAMTTLTMRARPCACAKACPKPANEGAWIVDAVPAGTASGSAVSAGAAWDTVCAAMRGVTNRHVYFRKTFTVPAAKRATLRFAADDFAAVTVDGALVAEGPETGFPHAQPVAEIDVTRSFARAGEHVIAADVYYVGTISRSHSGGDGRFGFRAVLALEGADGSRHEIATDGSWRTFVARTRQTKRKALGYGTGFNEDADLRQEPAGWRLAGFDDRAWKPATAVVPDYTFIAAQGRPLQYVTRRPVKTERRADGSWFWDMGEEMAGTPIVTLSGTASGQRVTLKEAEELAADGSVRFKMRCNCDYSDTFTLNGGNDTLDLYDYRAFRYIALEGWNGAPPALTVRERHYPFDFARTSLACADERFARIWRLCARGLAVGVQDRYTDCPTREKGQYTGDAWLTAVPRWFLTADATIWRKAVLDFARTQTAEDPWLLCVAPGSLQQRLAEWSMLWPALAADYADMTGDRSLSVQLVRDGTVARFAAGFRALENAAGLHCDPAKKLWILVDWPKNQRCGYDYDATVGKGGVNTWANAFLYGMFRNIARMYRQAGDVAGAAAYETRAAAFRKAFNAAFLDPATGVYRDGIRADGTPSPKTSHAASAGALYWGLVPDEAKPRVIAKLKSERAAGSIFTAFYTIAALIENGAADTAWDIIAGDDAHSWATMLREGATTPFEAWSKEDKWNTSLCHPFASVPVSLLVRHLLGYAADPVAKTIRLAPKNVPAMPAFTLKLPLPDGATCTLERTAAGCVTATAPGWCVRRDR